MLLFDLGNLKNIFPNLTLLIMNWKLFSSFLLRKSNLLISHFSFFSLILKDYKFQGTKFKPPIILPKKLFKKISLI